uniref:ADP-ribosylation factor-like isoform X1 n=1 Tax=Rhizophora mucronata TaxID=61149 RepID=A0A2P2KYM4_RHIMU
MDDHTRTIFPNSNQYLHLSYTGCITCIAGISRAHVPLLEKDYMRAWTGCQTILQTRLNQGD